MEKHPDARKHVAGKSTWGKIHMGCTVVLQTESEAWEIPNKLNDSLFPPVEKIFLTISLGGKEGI